MRLPAWVVLLLLAAGQANAACEVRPRTRVPLTVTNGTIIIEVLVNDRPARMILDTGAQRSVISRAALSRLDLALDEWVATTMRGIGGVERHRNALPRSLSLGGVALERRTRTRDTSLTVGTLPAGMMDGLLGRDFLSLFDLDLDLPGRTVTLYSVAPHSGAAGCPVAFLPWTVPYASLPVSNPADSALVVGVGLDGVALRALLDTGASATVLLAPGMVRLGLTPQSLSASPASRATGLGPRSVHTWHHTFRTFDVGAERIATPLLRVAAMRATPIVDMLLGADWLAGRRVWISFATRQVFVEHRPPR